MYSNTLICGVAEEAKGGGHQADDRETRAGCVPRTTATCPFQMGAKHIIYEARARPGGGPSNAVVDVAPLRRDAAQHKFELLCGLGGPWIPFCC